MNDDHAVRFAVTIHQSSTYSDVVRVVRQDDYDVSEAIAQAFRMVREDAVNIHMPFTGRLTVTVERVR